MKQFRGSVVGAAWVTHAAFLFLTRIFGVGTRHLRLESISNMRYRASGRTRRLPEVTSLIYNRGIVHGVHLRRRGHFYFVLTRPLTQTSGVSNFGG
jgi:hypothetical protein